MLTSPISIFAISKDRKSSDSSQLLTITHQTTQWHNITITPIFAVDIYPQIQLLILFPGSGENTTVNTSWKYNWPSWSFKY